MASGLSVIFGKLPVRVEKNGTLQYITPESSETLALHLIFIPFDLTSIVH